MQSYRPTEVILCNHSNSVESRALLSHSYKAPISLINPSHSRNGKIINFHFLTIAIDTELDVQPAITPFNVIEENMKSSLSSSDFCTSANEDEGRGCSIQHKVTGSNVNPMGMNTRPRNEC